MSRIAPAEPASLGVAPRRSLSDLLWVANTRHGPGGHWFARVTVDDGDHDHLATPRDAVRYLSDHHVELPVREPDDRDLDALRAIREMTRGLLDATNGWTPEVRAILDDATFRLDKERRLVSEGDPWHAFAGDLMLPLLELVNVRDRLSICGNPVCRLVFLDSSKSGTRRWCDDAGCGNRHRVRRHREAVAAG